MTVKPHIHSTLHGHHCQSVEMNVLMFISHIHVPTPILLLFKLLYLQDSSCPKRKQNLVVDVEKLVIFFFAVNQKLINNRRVLNDWTTEGV